MIMGGEIYLGQPTQQLSWSIGRELRLQIAAHILSPFGMRPTFDNLASTGQDQVGQLVHPYDRHVGHMAWQKVKDKGAQVSLAVPIEMNMRHGIPPILKMQDLRMEPSLSSDVETNMTACFFTQMRSMMTMQRMVVNQKILDSGLPPNPSCGRPFPSGLPRLLNVRDVLRYATINGAKHLRLDGKTGSLKPQKEADIIILDANHLNVFPVNHVPGAVVQMMDRSNVETVIVAGKVRKWKGSCSTSISAGCAPARGLRATTSTRTQASHRTCSAEADRMAVRGGFGRPAFTGTPDRFARAAGRTRGPADRHGTSR